MKNLKTAIHTIKNAKLGISMYYLVPKYWAYWRSCLSNNLLDSTEWRLQKSFSSSSGIIKDIVKASSDIIID